jgi:excisionase family DNA binding protein
MLCTVDELAKMLNKNPRTIRRYIEKGQLRAERIGGSWRISEEAVKELFDAPEVKESISKHLSERTEDMVSLYLKNKHRLQKSGLVMMFTFVFNPQKETWVLPKTSEWMAELSRPKQEAQFDFTMTGNEQGLYRITLIAPPAVLQSMIAELERLRQALAAELYTSPS